MYFLDQITVGDQDRPLYQSYEYSPQSRLLGLPTWSALLLVVAFPIIAFLLFYLYGKHKQ